MQVQDELFGEFIEESKDILQSIYDGLEGLLQKDRAVQAETIDNVFRWVHTIKGSCIMFGMKNTNKLAHTLESYMSKLKEGQLALGSEVIKLINLATDDLARLIEEGDEQIPSDYDWIVHQLEHWNESAPSSIQAPTSVSTPTIDTLYFRDYLEKSGTDPQTPLFEVKTVRLSQKILDVLQHHGIELVTSQKSGKNQVEYLFVLKGAYTDRVGRILENFQNRRQMRWVVPYSPAPELKPEPENVIPLKPKLKPVAKENENGNEKREEETERKERAGGSGDVIRVPVERVNQVLDYIWEIFLIRNQLSYLVNQNQRWLNENPEFMKTWEFLDASLESNITELESKSMRMRMSSIRGITTRLKQTIRNYVDKSDKQIRFVVNGEDTELDKKIIDMLNEPLIHLIRNCCDHGIESVAKRKANGKKAEGTITLSTQIVGNEVVLKIQDDGGGIDPQKLLIKAREKGIDTTDLESDEDVIGLIFRSGFSTAESVSEMSGRGVGMDAVKKSLMTMGGTVNISSEIGKGTLFTITLPLSMSVVSALVLKVNNSTFACTTNPIIETKIIKLTDLKKNCGELYYLHQSDYIKCLDLRPQLFNHDVVEDPFIRREDAAICLIENRGKKVALLIDHIQEYYSLVIKPMPLNTPQIPFIIGASILATGEPIFIFSLNKLCDYFSKEKIKDLELAA